MPVTVDSNGNVSGSGYALALYNSIFALETANKPLPNPDAPPANFEGTAKDWSDQVAPIVHRMRQVWAREANAHEQALGSGTSVGVPGRHQADADTVGLWQFDSFSTLGVDTSGNGRDLAIEVGTARTTYILPGYGGVYFDGSTALWHSAAEAAFRLYGDMTFEAVVLMQTITAGAYWFSHTAGGDTEDTNQLYGLQYQVGTAPSIFWIQERGGGTNDQFSPASMYMPVGRASHMAVSRIGGVVQCYLDGRLWGVTNGTPYAAPTGGTTGRFRIGGDAATRITGAMASARLSNRGRTPEEIKQSFNTTLGPVFGVIP